MVRRHDDSITDSHTGRYLFVRLVSNRNRRLAKDFEATVESAVTWLYIASVKLMSRRLAAT